MYFILPETENRTLEEIEKHFSENSRKLTDRNIQKFSDQSVAEMDEPSKANQTSNAAQDSRDIDTIERQTNGVSTSSTLEYVNRGFVHDNPSFVK